MNTRNCSLSYTSLDQVYLKGSVMFQMTGGSEEDSGPEPTSAWCNSTSVGNTNFTFQWQISDYQRKKESVKRDDSIQSSTFTVQVSDEGSGLSAVSFITLTV